MKKYILIITTLLAAGISGCKKDFLSLEVNPNTPSVTTPQFALAGAEKVAADIVNTNYSHYAVWGGIWTSSGNYVPSPALQQYQFTTDNYQVFTQLYQNLTNFNNLEKMSTADPSLANFQAIAKIMKVYDFQQLVDNYNDVPYSQAFKAPAVLFPAYDKGPAIYDDLVKQLDAAISIIGGASGKTSPGTSDIVFGGDMTKWKQFANTLKLRIALRESNLAANTAKSDLSTSASDYMDGTYDAAANPGYSNSDANGGQESPFWRVYGYDQNGNTTGNWAYYRANNYSVSLLSSFNDPRLPLLYAPNSTGAVVGIKFGDPNAPANAVSSAIGPGLLKSPTMGGVLMSAAEALFLQAEGNQRGYIATGSAQTFFESGITAAFVAVGLTAADAQAYYGQGINNVSWASSTDKIQAIITQKYIALNGYGNLEAYNELRRTGFPVGVPSSIDPKAISTTAPSRIFYPTSEYQQNAANVAKEGTINPFTSKIFWAQ